MGWAGLRSRSKPVEKIVEKLLFEYAYPYGVHFVTSSDTQGDPNEANMPTLSYRFERFIHSVNDTGDTCVLGLTSHGRVLYM